MSWMTAAWAAGVASGTTEASTAFPKRALPMKAWSVATPSDERIRAVGTSRVRRIPETVARPRWVWVLPMSRSRIIRFSPG